jgi:nitrite reductase (NO-forming)
MNKTNKTIFSFGLIKKMFILTLSVGFVIGIVTSYFPTSISHFNWDAKAVSNGGKSGAQAGVSQDHPHKEVTLNITRANVTLKAGQPQVEAWTFNGTVPGPTLRFTEGDNVTIHLKNYDNITKGHTNAYHTLHLHGDHEALADGVFEMVRPNHSYDYNFIAGPPGAFPYHCHAMPTSLHVRMGMYGLMIIDPKKPLPPAREYEIVFGEYSSSKSEFRNITKMAEQQYYLINGYYKDMQGSGNSSLGKNYLPVRQNELVRLYVVNDGAGLVYPFHIHGTIFKAYPSGLLSNLPENRQTFLIGPGDAAIIEAKWQYPGSYIFHPHGIEEENGGIGCFYVIPSNNIASEVTNHVCKPYPADSISPHTEKAQVTDNNTIFGKLNPVIDKSISMIDKQYNLQKELQKPTLIYEHPKH